MIEPITIRRARPAHARSSEDGFTLLAVIFLMTVLTLWMAVAVPKMTRSIQRDRDVETMHRGKQYIRGIQLYYRKFHAYPPNIDALVKTNEIRFVRKRYLDPMTGKDDWKPIMVGQNKVPIAMGFFGQPLLGTSLVGIGPSGGNGLQGGGNGLQGSPGQFGNPGQTGSIGAIFNSQQSPTNSSPTTTTGQTGTDTSTGASDGSSGGAGTGTGTGTSATDSNGNPTSGTTGAAGSPSGQTFGGAGICGFSPASPKQSIVVFKKKNHYNEWEFTYDPIMEQLSAMGGLGAPGAGLNGNGLGPGNNNSSNPFGNNSNPFSSSGNTPTPPNQQQTPPTGNPPGFGTPPNN
jgi:type II secretory pathway pseudopilin PulG